MSFDFIELLSDFLDRHVGIEEVPKLTPVLGPIRVILFEGFDIVIGVCAEELSVDVGVYASLACPCLPEFIVQWVGDEVILRTLENLIHADCRRLGIRMLGCIIVLCREQAKMLSPQLSSKGRCKARCLIRFSVHCAVDEILVLDNDGELAVVVSKLGLRTLVCMFFSEAVRKSPLLDR